MVQFQWLSKKRYFQELFLIKYRSLIYLIINSTMDVHINYTVHSYYYTSLFACFYTSTSEVNLLFIIILIFLVVLLILNVQERNRWATKKASLSFKQAYIVGE